MREIKSYVISIPSLYTRLEQSFWSSFNKVHSINPELDIGIEGKDYELPELSDTYASLLKKKITDIQINKSEDPYGWRVKV